MFNLQDSVAFPALMLGLYPSIRFKMKLAESKASTLFETIHIAQKFHTGVRHLQDPWGAAQEKNDHLTRADTSRDAPRRDRDKKPRTDDDVYNPRYNINRREIYLDIKEKPILLKPPPIKKSISMRNKKALVWILPQLRERYPRLSRAQEGIRQVGWKESWTCFWKTRMKKNKEPCR